MPGAAVEHPSNENDARSGNCGRREDAFKVTTNIALASAPAKPRDDGADSFVSLTALGYGPLLIPIVPPGASISERSSIALRMTKTGRDDRGKTPGIRGDDGFWRGVNWRVLEATAPARAAWQAMGAGVGIRTGLLPDGRTLIGFDADTRDRPIAEAIFACLARHFGKDRIRPRFGERPRGLYPFLIDGPYPYKRVLFGDQTPRERVELLSDGKQFVAAGIHPRTNRPYEWPLGIPALNDVPCVSPAQMDACLDELRAILPNATDVHQDAAASDKPVDQARLRGDPALLEQAIKATPNTSEFFEAREEWLRMGYAFKAGCGPENDAEAFAAFADWSADWRDPPDDWRFDEDYVRAEWGRMKPPFRVGAAYVFEMAERAGKGAPGAFSRAKQWFEERPAYEPLFPEEARAEKAAIDFEALTAKKPDALTKFEDRAFVMGTRFQPGVITMGSGPPGVSKSAFSCMSGLAIASARALTGEHVWTPGPVLIYNAEDPTSELQRRLAACARAHGVDIDVAGDRVRLLSGYDSLRLCFAERRERNGVIVPGEHVDQFAAFIRQQRIVYVALDPMISLYRGLDENSSSDMEALGVQLRRFAQLSGAAVDLIHHTVKNRSGNSEANAGNADASRGSGGIGAFVRGSYTLQPMDRKTWVDLGLPDTRGAQMVRLDDAKRNYTRRSTRETWFEIQSILPSGELVEASDFASEQKGIVFRALSSVGVHVKFDVHRQRALQAIHNGDDKEKTAASTRDFIVSSMTAETADRKDLAAVVAELLGVKSTTARNRINELIPTLRKNAAAAQADGWTFLVWREERVEKGVKKWVVCRERKEQTGAEFDDTPTSAPSVFE